MLVRQRATIVKASMIMGRYTFNGWSQHIGRAPHAIQTAPDHAGRVPFTFAPVPERSEHVPLHVSPVPER